MIIYLLTKIAINIFVFNANNTIAARSSERSVQYGKR